MSEEVKSEKCICGREVKNPAYCGTCARALCKSCEEFISPQFFSFMTKIPAEVQLSHYCSVCYVTTVQPVRRAYADMMRLAREVLILDKPRRKPLPILKKSAEQLRVVGCEDEEETVLRLGFLAAERGFNSVVKANIAYKKVITFGYQKMIWEGTGFGADLDKAKLAKRED